VTAAPDGSGWGEPPPASPAPTPPPETGHLPPVEATGYRTQYTPRTDGKSIEVGDVLNHIFEVKRFIARGGMGEVFEGCNINSDERVAIKVMLPSLAADPNVVSMFRKEARTLTRLQHEALVQYRVLAQEPQLGVLYIVTEYVDGVNLSDVLGTLNATPEEMTGLLRRLASGLRAAHALGAIHRDISPDNVLLEGGKLSGAKIIDFGIAKDLDPGSATIVGDGFAGKLSYVAPEQLGAYGRDVGAWSDIYSLGLVMVAVAQGRNVNMGGTLFDAVEKRRDGPNIDAVPEILKPVIEAMLRPDPKDRLRSADEVLKMLDRRRLDRSQPAAPAAAVATGPASRDRTKAALIGGGAAGLALLGVAGWMMLPSDESSTPTAPGQAEAPSAPTAPGDPVARAEAAINSVLPDVSCTWLDIDRIDHSSGTLTVAFKGVAGDATKASSELARALTSAGFPNPNIDFGRVASILPAGCGALNAYRSIRDPGGNAMVPAQTSFRRELQTSGDLKGKLAARVVFDFTPGDGDFSLHQIEPSGKIEQLNPDRATFLTYVEEDKKKANPEDKVLTETSPGGYRVSVQSDNDSGWTGLLLIQGGAPFPEAVTAPPLGQRGPDWLEKFTTMAATRNPTWKAEMVWIKLN
jgi:serine/threonine-protein kinase